MSACIPVVCAAKLACALLCALVCALKLVCAPICTLVCAPKLVWALLCAPIFVWRSYVLQNLYVKKLYRIYYTTLSYTMDTFLAIS